MEQDTTTADLLKDPLFFHCENWKATMKKTVCVVRQTIGIKESKTDLVPRIPSRCDDCKQGKAIQEEVGNEYEGVCPLCLNFPARARFNGLCGHCNRDWKKRKDWKARLKREGQKTMEEQMNDNRKEKKSPDTVLQEERGNDYIAEVSAFTLNTYTGGVFKGKADRMFLVLDITNYMEDAFMENLKEAARRDIRNIEHEALYFIVSALKVRQMELQGKK